MWLTSGAVVFLSTIYLFSDAAEYSESTALILFDLSSAAYRSDPQKFLDQSSKTEFEVLKSIEVPCEHTQCFGFVAKTNSSVYVAFRGTDNHLQLLEEGGNLFRPRLAAQTGGYVEPFFHDAHVALWYELALATLHAKSLLANPNADLYVTGHSLGGALAALFASRMSSEGYFGKDHIQVITFGEPRVGDAIFAKTYDSLVPHTWRVVHRRDIVPHLPFCVPNPYASCDDGDPIYYHHGTEVFYKSSAMKPGKKHGFQICNGSPRNEDNNCSNGLVRRRPCYDVTTCVHDHLHYFERNVSGH